MSQNTPVRTLRIATRSSPLALWQAQHVSQLITAAAPDVAVEVVHVSTLGDRDRTESLAQFGGQGVFTREVQKVVLDGQADLAVHSLKDLPTETVEGLTLAGIPARAPRFDALILPVQSQITTLADVPPGTRIGTGSPRRQAQLRFARPDLELVDIRGNVETRLRKVDTGEYDAVVLAAAGLTRLEWAERISFLLEPPLMFPAVGQAALGIECRVDDRRTCEILAQISDPVTRSEVLAERACLATLRAGCHAPVGTLSVLTDQTLTLTGVVLSLDGLQRFEATCSGSMDVAPELGRELARQLIANGANRVLRIEPPG